MDAIVILSLGLTVLAWPRAEAERIWGNPIPTARAEEPFFRKALRLSLLSGRDLGTI
jgi:hypothetical protein